MKQQRQFLYNNSNDLDAIESILIISLRGEISANLLWHHRLLAQLKTKLRVTCRCHQIDVIVDETFQPSTDL